MKNIFQTFGILAFVKYTSGSALNSVCCPQIVVSGEAVHENLQGLYTRVENKLNGRTYYQMTNRKEIRTALWTNHLNHWIIGYESDALAGYDSGFFYTVPQTEEQKNCPHISQLVWKKWITDWRRWGDVDQAFSVRCLDDKPATPPFCPIMTMSCDGPFFEIEVNHDCRRSLKTFMEFEVEDFKINGGSSIDCNIVDSGPFKFNAGQCDTKLGYNSKGGSEFITNVTYDGDAFDMDPVTLKCENSPAWLKDKYSTHVYVELSYYHTRKLLIADISGD